MDKVRQRFTPLAFAVAPPHGTTSRGPYSYQEQQSSLQGMDTTYNGTQTFNTQGHPSDSDHD